jgi:hypothetical protein
MNNTTTTTTTTTTLTTLFSTTTTPMIPLQLTIACKETRKERSEGEEEGVYDTPQDRTNVCTASHTQQTTGYPPGSQLAVPKNKRSLN